MSLEKGFRRTALLVALFVAPCQLALKEVDDPDVFLHLRVGDWVLRNGFPATDPFSTFGEGKPYVAYSWLFDVVCELLYRGLGWTGLVLATVAFTALIAALLVRLARGSRVPFTQGAVVVVLGMVAMFQLVSPRPWLFTIAAYAFQLDALARYREDRDRRRLLPLPFLYAVWANVHVQFVYGLCALGIFCLEEAPRRVDRALVAVTALSTLATLANPWHVHLWGVILEYAQARETGALIQEHAAMSFREVSHWAVLGLTLAAVAALGWRRERRLAPYLLVGVGAFFAFKAARDAWFVAVPAVAALAGTFATDEAEDPFVVTRGQAIATGLATLLLLGMIALGRGLSERALDRTLSQRYPVAAAEFVANSNSPGPVFNDYPWGDYLLWKVPRLKVSIDGRTNLHGDERIARVKATWAGRPGWEKDPDLAAAGVVIGDREAVLTDLLRMDARFGVAYEDSRAVVFVARGR